MSPTASHRLPLRTSADTDGKNRDVLAALEASGEDITILRLLANSPTLLRPMVMMANALMQRAALAAVDREVVVLHTAKQRDNSYEWDEHVGLSAKAGVTEQQRTEIAAGGAIRPPLFTESQCLGVAFADELLGTGALSDAMWDTVCGELGVEAALDLLFAVAFWGGMVPLVTAGLGLVHRSEPT